MDHERLANMYIYRRELHRNLAEIEEVYFKLDRSDMEYEKARTGMEVIQKILSCQGFKKSYPIYYIGC